MATVKFNGWLDSSAIDMRRHVCPVCHDDSANIHIRSVVVTQFDGVRDATFAPGGHAIIATKCGNRGAGVVITYWNEQCDHRRPRNNSARQARRKQRVERLPPHSSLNPARGCIATRRARRVFYSSFAAG
jgi:hypothetical protein